MGRKGRLDRQKFKNRSTGNRKSNSRAKRQYFLIVCEGEETEPNYFKALARELPRGLVQVDIEGTGYNTRSLVKRAETIKSEKEKFSTRKIDEVWVVFDRDSFPRDDFNAAVSKCEKKPRFFAGYSIEAFELWYLLHFAYHNTGMSRDQYRSKLEKHVQNCAPNTKWKYLKNDPEIYSLLKTYGDEAQAIKYAENLFLSYTDQRYAGHDPCTTVHQLVQKLNVYK